MSGITITYEEVVQTITATETAVTITFAETVAIIGSGGGATNLGYTASPTNGIVTSDTGADATLPLGTGTNAGLLAPAQFTKLSNLSGTNTGDQTTIVGITGTKSQFDTAVTDGNFMYTGDAPTAHTHPQSDVTNLTTDLAAKADKVSITGATKTKITYNAQGIVTAGADIAASDLPTAIDAVKIANGNVSNTEFQYLDGVTSAIQTQIDSKLAATDGAITVTSPSTTSAGYLGIPQNSKSAAYTTVMSDAGKHILHPAADTNARTFTIDSNANVAYPIGTTLTFINETANVVTIAITSDTLVLAGTGSTGSRSLAQYGMATAVKITSTKWYINGNGLT